MYKKVYKNREFRISLEKINNKKFIIRISFADGLTYFKVASSKAEADKIFDQEAIDWFKVYAA